MLCFDGYVYSSDPRCNSVKRSDSKIGLFF